MNILIKLNSDSELIGYETFALAFLLASFDHHVQLLLSNKSVVLFDDEHTRVFGMVQSLALYDLPMAWAEFDIAPLDKRLHTVLTPTPKNVAEFDSVLEFNG